MYLTAVRIHAELLARDAARTRGAKEERSGDAHKFRILGLSKLFNNGDTIFTSLQLACQRAPTFLTTVLD